MFSGISDTDELLRFAAGPYRGCFVVQTNGTIFT
jgi:hypothetical protein